MEYMVRYSDDVSILQAGIKEMLEEGWELAGGVCVAEVEKTPLFAQAVVKKSS